TPAARRADDRRRTTPDGDAGGLLCLARFGASAAGVVRLLSSARRAASPTAQRNQAMRRAGFWRLGGVLCGLALGGCRAQQPAPPSSPPPPAAAPIQFKDVTQAAGVNGTR